MPFCLVAPLFTKYKYNCTKKQVVFSDSNKQKSIILQLISFIVHTNSRILKFSIFACMKFRAPLLTCALFLVNANASEIHPFLRGFLPADVDVSRVLDGGSSETTYSTGFTAEIGAEFLADKESVPFYFGGGIGFMRGQRKDKLKVTPHSFPIWGALSLRSPKTFKDIAPYGTLRAGWLMPATTSSAWWEKPKNFMVDAGVGIHYAQSVGFEFSYTFTSFEKSFEEKDLSYRFSSGRFGASCYWNFEITRKHNYVPNEGTTPEDEE